MKVPSLVTMAGPALAIGGCAFGGVVEPGTVEMELDPMLDVQPASQMLEVWSVDVGGATWRLVALRSADDVLCVLDGRDHEVSGAVCGLGLLPGELIGGVNSLPIAGQTYVVVHALVGSGVEGMRAAVDGQRVDGTVASLRRLGMDERIGAVLVPVTSERIVVELLDDGGGVIAEQPLGPLP